MLLYEPGMRFFYFQTSKMTRNKADSKPKQSFWLQQFVDFWQNEYTSWVLFAISALKNKSDEISGDNGLPQKAGLFSTQKRTLMEGIWEPLQFTWHNHPQVTSFFPSFHVFHWTWNSELMKVTETRNALSGRMEEIQILESTKFWGT